ncbi:hypothetical protein [Agrobacterium tumefaciens]|uniref:hypothetical protein n=1 Tax=Agrobacterium tumefaciens TaxID=358 RepID=UPI001574B229|nr:hypothetical protein [Agrobacterium tumefaciens]NTB05951.1 hypothetical protein [Agrobacterium tumefaciens]
MKLADYRELTRALLQVADDWHACVGTAEQDSWRMRAEALYGDFLKAECARATTRDSELRTIAQQRYQDLVALHPERPYAATKPVARPAVGGRAGGYNKSAARAVRLSRAARSTMRRSYF